ncbi:MAG: hypothetical protein KDE48_20140 [Anaerolineales bacterium]|nr:hypothetical protein [Anaerolineales bacterium]
MTLSNWFAAEKASPLIIGHRGASVDAPENTLAAFYLAIEQGADGIELDVQLSADGKIVIFHDDDVTRVSKGQGKVKNMTLSQLKALDLGYGQKIPTLDELFEMLGPTALYNIEIKDFRLGDHGLETAVADRVAAHNLASHVLISSFNPLAVRRANRLCGKATPTGLLREAGLSQYSYLIAPADADHPHHTMVNANYMAWAKKRGQRVNVWTVDDPVEARRLADLGVDGIITNKPAFLRASLM